MKRCKFCGRSGARLTEIPLVFSRWPSGEFACRDRQACGRRAAQIGQWIGTRVLRRRDLDGTRWTIRRWDDIGLRGLSTGPWTSGYVLLCEYRKHRSTSWHPTVQLAKAHRDDVVRSWEARSMREYAGGGR